MDKQAVSSSNNNYQYMFNLFTINIYNKKGFNFLQDLSNYLHICYNSVCKMFRWKKLNLIYYKLKRHK